VRGIEAGLKHFDLPQEKLASFLWKGRASEIRNANHSESA
jgi:hypothetical protein